MKLSKAQHKIIPHCSIHIWKKQHPYSAKEMTVSQSAMKKRGGKLPSVQTAKQSEYAFDEQKKQRKCDSARENKAPFKWGTLAVLHPSSRIQPLPKGAAPLRAGFDPRLLLWAEELRAEGLGGDRGARGGQVQASERFLQVLSSGTDAAGITPHSLLSWEPRPGCCPAPSRCLKKLECTLEFEYTQSSRVRKIYNDVIYRA